MKVKNLVAMLEKDVEYEIVYKDEFVKDIEKNNEKILNSEVIKLDVINDTLIIIA